MLSRPHPLFFPSDPHSMLLDAIDRGVFGLAQTALARGADPATTLLSNGHAALHWLAERAVSLDAGDASVVPRLVHLLVGHGADPDATSRAGAGSCTPLAILVGPRHQSLPMVTALLEAGADPNQTIGTTSSFERPLHAVLGMADRTARHDLVAVLLKHGADPNLLNHERLTVLQALARDPARAGDGRTALLLIEHGADLRTPSDANDPALRGRSAMGLLEQREARVRERPERLDTFRGEVLLAPIVRAWLETQTLTATLAHEPIPSGGVRLRL